MSENYKFTQHLKCEFFPCHNVNNIDTFNCLFCYCPLYLLKDECGGDFVYTNNGIKDCSNCLKPHTKESYDFILSKWPLILEKVKPIS